MVFSAKFLRIIYPTNTPIGRAIIIAIITFQIITMHLLLAVIFSIEPYGRQGTFSFLIRY
jgi:hypothetical protein